MPHRFDILILGGGPAGSAAALALKDSGLKVALADKCVFPRHKTCGDAIPGPALKMLKQLLPDFTDELKRFTERQLIKHCKITAPNGRTISIEWKEDACNSSRLDFDNFLFSLVKKYTGTVIYEGFEAGSLQHSENGWEITGRNDDQLLSARLLIGCDGANSLVTKQAAMRLPDHSMYCTAVSAYYRGIACAENTNEFFLLKNYLPGYFWVFPLGNGIFNAGFGIMAAEASKRKLKLREILEIIIETEPVIKTLFTGTVKISETHGFGLPLGGKKIPVSGENFMLAGDAASLIDPLQGHGIDKAVYSGVAAARQAARCFEYNNFSADYMRSYDDDVYAKYNHELKRNYRLMRLLHRQPWLANAAARLAGTGAVKKIIAKWF